jgi:ABC-2 type transport system ATP-binding protein
VSTDAIVAERLSKQYDGRVVLDELDLSIRGGELFALLGPNGAGKTTTVEIIEGYRRPDGGTVRVFGHDPRHDAGSVRPLLGLMLQSGGLYSQLRPIEALELFAAFYPDPLEPVQLLARVGLAHVARTRYRDLSGGERQRLSLALAIVGRPRLAILDEPTGAMDAQARRDTWAVLRELREGGTTILLTTHLLDEAEALADRVAIIDHGRLVALGTPAELRRGLGVAAGQRASGADGSGGARSRAGQSVDGAAPGGAGAAGGALAGEPAVDLREVRLELAAPLDSERLTRLGRLPSVQAVRVDRPGVYVLRTASAGELLVEISTWLLAAGLEPLAIRVGQGSLEDVFLRLVGEGSGS